MSDQIKIKVTERTEFGKGAARRARRADLIPAVVYGHGAEPRHILMPALETILAVRNPNALLVLVDEAGEETLVLPKDIQRHMLKINVIDHIDLLVVRRGEKVVVEVPVHVEGETAPGTEYVLDYASVPVEAEATHLPESATISIEGREAGEHVYATDVTLQAGTVIQLDDEQVIATVSEVVEQDLGDESDQEAQAAEGSEGSGEGESSDAAQESSDSEGSED